MCFSWVWLATHRLTDTQYCYPNCIFIFHMAILWVLLAILFNSVFSFYGFYVLRLNLVFSALSLQINKKWRNVWFICSFPFIFSSSNLLPWSAITKTASFQWLRWWGLVNCSCSVELCLYPGSLFIFDSTWFNLAQVCAKAPYFHLSHHKWGEREAFLDASCDWWAFDWNREWDTFITVCRSASC